MTELRAETFTGLVLLAGGVFAIGVGCEVDKTDVRDSGSDASDGTVALPPSDASRVVDGGLRDASRRDATGAGCVTHHDCLQGSFCHRGTCREDEVTVYHCGKPGCPPGQWCVEVDGRRSICAESLEYACEDACDCGPAHCCIDEDGDPATPKRCVRDADDPYLSGEPTAGVGASCRVGNSVPLAERTPTYCATDFSCLGAQLAWLRDLSRTKSFQAFDRVTGAPIGACKGTRCFASSCGCDPGHQCIDPSGELEPGRACGALGLLENKMVFGAVGLCVKDAIVESAFGWRPDELWACCSESCSPGTPCDLTWMRRGSRSNHERVEATCGTPEDCVCGDDVCCPSELETCLEDCLPGRPECGNGACEPFETAKRCPTDCAQSCGDGRCSSEEGPADCPADCLDVCGDGDCSADENESCAADCDGRCLSSVTRTYSICGDRICNGKYGEYPCILTSTERETCLNCPHDCGRCNTFENCSIF